MGRTIETVEAVAQLLAGYDIDTVAKMLSEAEGRLPPAMHGALQRLEQNLRAYRPYLPKSCLPAQEYEMHPDVAGHQASCADSSSSELTSSNSDLSGVGQQSPSGIAHVLGALKSMRATLLVVNTRNVLGCLEKEEGPQAFTSFFEMLLGTAMTAAESRRGLVDVFVGDRILASFNTSRSCFVHGTAAVGAAQQIVEAVRSYDSGASYEARVDIGAASGRILCGDTGCAEMRRFSLLGSLAVVACGMERAAQAFDLDVVCNTMLQRDALYDHVLLLVPRCVRLVKQSASGGDCIRSALTVTGEKGDDGTCHVYHLLVQNTGNFHDQSGEWMYHIGVAESEWDPYNAAMREYLENGNAEPSGVEGKHHRRAYRTINLLGSTTPLNVHV